MGIYIVQCIPGEKYALARRACTYTRTCMSEIVLWQSQFLSRELRITQSGYRRDKCLVRTIMCNGTQQVGCRPQRIDAKRRRVGDSPQHGTPLAVRDEVFFNEAEGCPVLCHLTPTLSSPDKFASSPTLIITGHCLFSRLLGLFGIILHCWMWCKGEEFGEC